MITYTPQASSTSVRPASVEFPSVEQPQASIKACFQLRYEISIF
jgi:hypothetical protein